MTFPEIFDKFKNHSYIRRKSWNKDVFIQLRHSTELIRMVIFEIGKPPYLLTNDCPINAEDLLGDDWIDIEDLIPKKEESKPTSFWNYIDTLDSYSDAWCEAIDLGSKYYKEGKKPDEYIDEIIKKVNRK